MNSMYASRMSTIPKSFIREILKVTEDPEIISFAGGLPNPRFFPVREIAQAATDILGAGDASPLQYSTTEGYRPLREFIAQRYREKKGLVVSADEILITNGSQQALDLLGKVFIDRNDPVAIERPAYLGAIQAFSAYEPHFRPVPLLEDGIDLDRLKTVLDEHRVKFFHTVINFQNPSGISYSPDKRKDLAALLGQHDTVVYCYEYGLKGIAQAFDRLHDRLSPQEKAKLLAHIEYHCENAYRWLHDQLVLHLNYQNSHGQQCMHAMFTTVLAIATDSDKGAFWVTHNDGVEWTKVSDGLPAKWVSRVIASQHEIGTVYASFTGFREDDFEAYLYASSDFGETWTPIRGNLPSESINVVREDPTAAEILYVGTDLGVYVSLDAGESWHSLSTNLPTTPVHDLVVHPRESELVIGTHGRSAWVLDVEPIRAYKQ